MRRRPEPTPHPSPEPTPGPTACQMGFISIGDAASTCVANLECHLYWTYAGAPDACVNVTVTAAHLDGTVTDSWVTPNDGHGMTMIPTNQELAEYTVTIACDDDTCASVTAPVWVSSSPAPTSLPSPPAFYF